MIRIPYEFWLAPYEEAVELGKNIDWMPILRNGAEFTYLITTVATGHLDDRWIDTSRKISYLLNLPCIEEAGFGRVRNDLLRRLCFLAELNTSDLISWAEILISRGADVNYSSKRISCIEAAASSQMNDELLLLLLKFGAKVPRSWKSIAANCERQSTKKILESAEKVKS